jgi:hypothetical protein
MWALPYIVFGESSVQIARYATVVPAVVQFTNENINIIEAVHRLRF